MNRYGAGMSENPWLSDENVLGLISDNCPDLIALLDANGFFVHSNTAHFIRLGRSAESLVGASVFDLIHPQDVAMFQKAITASAKRRTVFQVTARWLREEGRDALLESLGKWINVDGGRSQYLLLSSREVTKEQHQAAPVASEADLRGDAARLLALAEGEKNQVARIIHDDLGQKLTAMSLELSLWKTELDGGHSKSVNAIREKIAVLGNLVNNVINSARQVTTTLRPRVLEEFGLAAALEWHLEKVQKQTGMSCSFSADREKLDVEPFVAAQIFRIAEEVLALRAAAGCKSLHVRALTQDDAIALVFEDTGRDRRLTHDICARVRLLGGELEVSHEERFIVVALPTKIGTPFEDL